jgi:hypothetical protein
MFYLAKKVKWRLHDCRSFLAGKRGIEESKTVHLLLCRVCNGYHRVNVKQVGEELADSEMPQPEMLFPGGRMGCPKTGEIFYAALDAWVHLTEREYDLRFSRK